MKPANVLIVEDETIVALDIKYQLQRQGYSVCAVFASGEETLEKIADLKPDLVLMDIRLRGDLDGVETAGLIRKTCRIPVVFITAYTDDETIERAKFIEPFGYLIKPFDERSLKTTIEMALYKSAMDKKLVESEEQYRKFFEEDLTGDFIAQADGTIITCNPAFIEMFQFADREEAAGTLLDDLFYTAADRDVFWNDLMLAGKILNRDLNLKTKQGAYLKITANVICRYGEDGGLRELIGYFIDNTEHMRLEEQLRHSQKMEAIGRLAGGIAHDFNNILTVIIGYTALAGEKLKDGNFFGDEIEGIKSAARRASNLTRQLLIFSRRQVWSPRVINLNHVLENMEKMIRRLIKENIGFQFFPDAENPYVYADTSQLEQVLINLAVNARDAMPAGGKLLIKTENLTNINPMEDPVQAAGEGINRSFVLLTVTDTGIGIEESNIEKIFDPFFTTKSLNEGTGLGLATVYGIVKQSGGHIKVSSVPGAGTSFLIYLPQADSKFETVPAETKIPALLAGNETILLVEDEDSVRELVSRYLSRKGYNVLEARNAGEALILFEQHANRVNLLITDILLPFMKGDELAERLRKTNPSLCTLFISGYPLPNRPDSGGADGTRLSWFMQKPFEADEILALVRQIFDNRQ